MFQEILTLCKNIKVKKINQNNTIHPQLTQNYKEFRKFIFADNLDIAADIPWQLSFYKEYIVD